MLAALALAAPVHAKPSLSCTEQDDRFGAVVMPAYQRMTTAEDRQRALIRANASLAVRRRAQLASVIATERVGDVARAYPPCSRKVERLRLMFVALGGYAYEAQAELQAVAQLQAAGRDVAARQAISALLATFDHLRRQSQQINVYVASLG